MLTAMDEHTTPPRYITTQEAATLLSVTPATIRALIGREIEGARFGRVLKVEAGSLEDYRRRQTIAPQR